MCIQKIQCRIKEAIICGFKTLKFDGELYHFSAKGSKLTKMLSFKKQQLLKQRSGIFFKFYSCCRHRLLATHQQRECKGLKVAADLQGCFETISHYLLHQLFAPNTYLPQMSNNRSICPGVLCIQTHFAIFEYYKSECLIKPPTKEIKIPLWICIFQKHFCIVTSSLSKIRIQMH